MICRETICVGGGYLKLSSYRDPFGELNLPLRLFLLGDLHIDPSKVSGQRPPPVIQRLLAELFMAEDAIVLQLGDRIIMDASFGTSAKIARFLQLWLNGYRTVCLAGNHDVVNGLLLEEHEHFGWQMGYQRIGPDGGFLLLFGDTNLRQYRLDQMLYGHPETSLGQFDLQLLRDWMTSVSEFLGRFPQIEACLEPRQPRGSMRLSGNRLTEEQCQRIVELVKEGKRIWKEVRREALKIALAESRSVILFGHEEAGMILTIREFKFSLHMAVFAHRGFAFSSYVLVPILYQGLQAWKRLRSSYHWLGDAQLYELALDYGHTMLSKVE